MNPVTLPKGVSVEGTFKFTSPKDHSEASLQITKIETDEMTYQLGMQYLGLDKY